MNYEQSIEYIHSFLTFGVRLGLERVSALLELLGNPQDELKFVHVAGTNGKGSTCTMIAKSTEKAGYKTGLYTSPYVVDFCERIQINGEMITHDELVKIIEKVKPLVEELTEKGLQPTEFELITAVAIYYFRQQNCDVVVLETGLGGRFDATNVVKKPLVSVITSVSYDHMEVLGDTLAKIAMEKCGIIKNNAVTVSYPLQNEEALEVIERTAELKDNKLIIPQMKDVRKLDESIFGTHIKYKNTEFIIPLQGDHQIANAVTAVEALKAMNENGLKITEEDIKEGIKSVKIPARMEILGEQPLIIMDGGHNEDCANALASVIREKLSSMNINAVMGMMADKEYEKYLSVTAPLFKSVSTAKPDNPRSLSAENLAMTAKKYCEDAKSFSTPEEAFEHALGKCKREDAVIICGSFYLASELRKYIIWRQENENICKTADK